MQQRVLILACFILATAFVVQQTYAKCNSCGDNGIACTNETHFHMCFGGVADVSQSFGCPTSSVCTTLQTKCSAPTDVIKADCSAENTGCGKCTQHKLFACTSRTTFAQCNGTALMANVGGRCPTGLLCDSTQGEICVDDCKITGQVECDREAAP